MKLTPPQLRVLRIVASHPDGIHRAQLAVAAETTSLGRTLTTLKNGQLVDVARDGTVKATTAGTAAAKPRTSP